MGYDQAFGPRNQEKPLIPAEAGICLSVRREVPAFAGMSETGF